MTDEEFAEKVDSEGGIWGALEYGLRAEQLENQDGILAQAWAVLERSYDSFKPVLAVIEEQLELALVDTE